LEDFNKLIQIELSYDLIKLANKLNKKEVNDYYVKIKKEGIYITDFDNTFFINHSNVIFIEYKQTI
jgi:hypothetical protein